MYLRTVIKNERRVRDAGLSSPRASALALLLASGLALTGCAAAGQSGAGGTPEASSPATAKERAEVASLDPRLVLAYDGGIMTLDAKSGEIVDDTKLDGFVRLNPAGDGRHVMISRGDGFTAYDTGLIAQAHGDHFHYYEQAPKLLEGASIEAPHAGHVVSHEGLTAAFADGTGAYTIFDPAGLGNRQLKVIAQRKTTAPHHGVAVPLANGAVLHTEGTEQERHSVVVEDASGAEIARTDECPGVHGEAAAQAINGADVISLGCESGPVVYRDGAFHKVAVSEDYQRSGNQKGHPASPMVLTDYKVEQKPANPEHPTRVGLLDTRDDSYRTLDLGSAYWFRSLARGTEGEALVLTGNGELNIIDPVAGTVTHRVPVMGAWTEKAKWQEPGPMLTVADGIAYVVDPEAKRLVKVQIATGERVGELELPVVAHEIEAVTGS